jgi:RimJ/RimL family protein N-acetyltransferase
MSSSKASMPAEIGFRPVAAPDGPLLEEWIARPHWQRWWGPAKDQAATIIAHIDDPDVGPFIFTLDGRDAGYIQWWRPSGEWEIPVDAPPETTRGIDMSIASAEDTGRGVGPLVLRAFIDRLAREGIRRFVIDPAPDNIAARRAYAKVGFVEAARGTHMDGPYVLMVLDLQHPEAE